MTDYLKELCTNLNIGLIYTEGDLTGLAVGIKNNFPLIKANRIFERCPENVAKAVIDYYTNSQYENKSLELIKSYIGDNVVSVEYTVEPSNEKFKNLLIGHTEINNPPQSAVEEQSTSKENSAKISTSKSSATKKNASKSSTIKKSQPKGDTPKKNPAKDKVPKDDLSSYIEVEIAKIIKSNFWGDSSKISPDEGINASTDDVINLDIEISDPKL